MVKKGRKSTKTPPVEDPRLLVVDSREKFPYSFSEECVVAKLDSGDYSIQGLENVFTVERKMSVAEIANNLPTARWMKELERLKKIPHAFLLLEFSLDDVLNYPIGSDIPRSRWKYIKVTPAFIISCLSSISLKYGVQVIYAGDRSNAQVILAALIKTVRKMYPVN